MNGWISVKDELPESLGEYIVSGLCGHKNEKPYRFVDVATSHGKYIDGFWDTFFDWDEGESINGILTITHWMPLPEPPKIDEEKEE